MKIFTRASALLWTPNLRSMVSVAAFVLIAAWLTLVGFCDLFTTFRYHDDEGYVLLSLLNFSKGSPLYTEVYSQYGPLFFLFNDALHRWFGIQFNHTFSRLVTLFYWISSAALCAMVVLRSAPAARLWGFFAFVGTFLHLGHFTEEPMHPGGFIVFVIALAAWLSTRALANQRDRMLGLIIGAAGVTLALTKINVGLLFFIAAGAWLTLQTRRAGGSRVVYGLTLFCFVVIPCLLMQPLNG